VSADVIQAEFDLLTENEAAALLRLTPSALRSWRQRGLEPPFIRVGGRAIRYRRQDLVDWLAANSVRPLAMGSGR
jgi:hypothetical protein